MTNEASRKVAVARLNVAFSIAMDARRRIYSAQEFAEAADMPQAANRIKRLQARMEAVIRVIETEARIMQGQRAPEKGRES